MRIGVIVGLVALAALLGWYLSFSASRLDRLHHRVEGSRAALDAQLVRRAEAAVELATSGLLDPSSALLVAGAAAEALAAGERETAPGADGDGSDRETAESDLSHALRLALDAERGRPGRGRRTARRPWWTGWPRPRTGRSWPGGSTTRR